MNVEKVAGLPTINGRGRAALVNYQEIADLAKSEPGEWFSLSFDELTPQQVTSARTTFARLYPEVTSSARLGVLYVCFYAPNPEPEVAEPAQPAKRSAKRAE